MAEPERPWWQHAVVYTVYPRSFADSDGDGIGDIAGLVGRLDHLAWLGVDAVWLTPIMPSPDHDWGYDVSDYMSVHPQLGTLADVDTLVAEAGRRGIRVLLDLVPNHTSIEHPWFREARTSRSSPRRDWYVWADAGDGGTPPNNWVSHFQGSAWTLDGVTGQMYLHNVLPEQPDLNWWNPQVRDEFDNILRFWFARGIAGFRIDVCHGIVKDALLRDNPVAGPGDPVHVVHQGQLFQYNENRPEVHDVIRRFRAVADGCEPPRVLLGETFAPDAAALGAFYGRGDELQLALNVPFVYAGLDAERVRAAVEATERALPRRATPTWTLSTHDVPRLLSRCRAPAAAAAVALLLLLTLRGAAVIYYGDEIGMRDVEVPAARRRDRVGRDGCRTPMQWEATAGAGFSAPGVAAWLPVGDPLEANVAAQREDPASPLRLARDLIALRRADAPLRTAAYRPMESPPGTYVFGRGRTRVVALNLQGRPVRLRLEPGRILLGTERRRDGEPCDGELALGPWEGALLHVPRR